MTRPSETNPAKPLRIMWFPAHPKEGSASMDRYWRELVAAQKQAFPSAELQIISALGSPPATTSRAGSLSRSLFKYFIYPLQAHFLSRRADVVHILDHSFAHLLKQVPSHVRKIVTVHDLAPLRDPGKLTVQQVERFRRAVGTLRLADLLLADSSHTKADIIELLQIPGEQIEVLPLGVDVEFFSKARPLPLWWRRDTSVIVSVGSTLPRKNLEILPSILRNLLEQTAAPITLIRVGQKLPDTLAGEIRKILGNDALVERGHASEEELAAIYQHADALIFPSLLEGFGLPLLEAMAAGCPVVSSDASSLPEVGGDAALYFEPEDAETAADQLARIFTDPICAARMKRAGRFRAAAVSWEAHLKQLDSIYRPMFLANHSQNL